MPQNKRLRPNAATLIESQRSIGYTFESALADILDNSISARANHIEIDFDSQKGYLAIVDNGSGMNQDSLEEAMCYGSKSSTLERHIDDLGRFGLGLKMASFSQCRKLTVVTKQANQLIGACWDLDHVLAQDDWDLLLLDQAEIEALPAIDLLKYQSSGTLVLWQNFDKLARQSDFEQAFLSQIDIAKRYVSLVFHQFLATASLEIRFNRRLLQGIDPFLSTNPKTQRLSPDQIYLNGEEIRMQAVILPYDKYRTPEEKRLFDDNQDLHLANSGLYIYRNKRLLVWGKWLRLASQSPLYQLARIQIELPNTVDDFWQIDIKKSSVQVPHGLRKRLKAYILDALKSSARVQESRGKKQLKTDTIQVFNRIELPDNQITYELNRQNPILQQLKQGLSRQQVGLLTTFMRQIEQHLPFESFAYDAMTEQTRQYEVQSQAAVKEELIAILALSKTSEAKQAMLATLAQFEDYQGQDLLFSQLREEIDNGNI